MGIRARCLPKVTGLLLVGALVGAGCAGDSEPTGSATTTTSAATTTTNPPAEPLAIESSTWDRGRIELSDGAVTEDWGVVAAPVEGGPYPVVLLLHGAHPTCPADTGVGRTWPCPEGTERANHEGLTYLAEALAARGFVTAAPGLNVQHTLGAGEPMAAVRTAEIATRTLEELVGGRLGVDAARVDADRLVLIGHSVGGQDAATMAAGRTSFSAPVDGVVLLQPALWSAEALPLADVPAVVVVSGCDGDTGVSGAQFHSDALLQVRERPAALVVLDHATHNGTNTGLAPDAFPVESPGCTPDRVLPADAQQHLLAEVVPELAHAVVRDGVGSGWAGAVFDAPAPPTGIQLDVLRGGQPVAAVPGSGPGLPAGIEVDGLVTTFCPLGYYTPFVEPGTEACHRPELPQMVGLPQTIAASWTAAGASLTAAVAAKAGEVYVVRAFADPADPALTGDVIRLRVTTPEGIDEPWALPVPESRHEPSVVFDLTHALVMWSTLRLPVPDGASGITITVESPAAGSMQLVTVGVER